MALTYTPQSKKIFTLPTFQLPTVTGENFYSSSISNAPAKVIVFICNHCPYVKAIETRLIQLGKDLRELHVPLVGICSNDPTDYPEDLPENLKKTWIEKGYGFPYLIDETQNVARQFDAVCTPDFFVFDKNNTLAYRGRLDDSWKDESKVTRQELKMAVLKIVSQEPIDFEMSPSMGCSIKWKNHG